MGWGLAAISIIVVALAAGFAWYERSRPSSKLVALVAALAALAVAGRVLLSPIPNVQPTTDITLLSGYVLGPAPGFVIGAVAALVSNVFLAQGPWTPWEMLGWAGAGLGGALMGRLTRLGRLPLSLACALAGLAFGAWMDLSLLLNFGVDRSSEGYLAIAAVSLPFNIAHALGNFVFCMVFGPGFVRALRRFRGRLEVHWEGPGRERRGGLVVGSLLVVIVAMLVAPAAAGARGTGDAARYLVGAQNADGGFGAAPGQSSSQLMTGWTVLGLEASGRNPLDVSRAGRTPIDYTRSNLGQLKDAAELARTILMLRGAGVSANSFGGRNLVADLLRQQDRNGSFRREAPTTAFALMALRAAGRSAAASPVRRAVAWLVAQQNRDGGFSSGARGAASDSDDTAAVVEALASAGRRRSKATRTAIAFLRRVQSPDGGFGQFPRSRSNAQSTAWAIQGMVAAGRDPAGVEVRGRSVVDYLASLQQANGSFRYSRTSAQTPVWVTAEALAALARKPFPLRPVARRARSRARAAATTGKGRGASRHPGRRARLRRNRTGGGSARTRPASTATQPVAAPTSAPVAAVAARRSSPSARDVGVIALVLGAGGGALAGAFALLRRV